MDWEKAKSILIIAFLVLNAGLFVFNAQTSQRYKLTLDEQKTISKILEDNDIKINCALPQEFAPMRPIGMHPSSWDSVYFMTTFFNGGNEVTRTNEKNKIIYKSGEKRVTIPNASSKNQNEFIFLVPKEDDSFSGTNAEKAEAVMGILGEGFSDFKLFNITKDDEGESYIYNDMLGDDVLFCSTVTVSFLDNGDISATVKKHDFDAYTGVTLNIVKSSEALLAFVHYKNENNMGSVEIKSLEIGYDIDKTSREEVIKATPFYRIIVADNPNPVYIDAISNNVL